MFDEKLPCQIEHYESVCLLWREGECLSGGVTWSEDGPDLEGYQLSYKLLKKRLAGKMKDIAYPDLNITREQLYFYANTVVWCNSYSKTQHFLRQHSGNMHRINGALSLLKGFQSAFNCKREDKMVQATSFSFGPRSFTKKIEFQNKEDAFFVSAIGPTLYVVPYKDVRPSIPSEHIRRKSIQIFTKGVGITIKGVSKFTDSDHIVVFSSRFLALVDEDELADILKKAKGTEEMSVLCAKRIIEVPFRWEIIDLKCLDRGKILIVFNQSIVIAEVQKGINNQFVIYMGTYIPSHYVYLAAGKVGIYGTLHPKLSPIRTCGFFREPGSMFLSSESGFSAHISHDVFRTFIPTESEVTKLPNMLAPFNNGRRDVVYFITHDYITIFDRVENKDEDYKNLQMIPFVYNKHFISVRKSGMTLVGKGSIFIHPAYVAKARLPDTLRLDVLCSEDLLYLELEEENYRLVCGANSAWEWVRYESCQASLFPPSTFLKADEGTSFVYVSGDIIYRITENSYLHGYNYKDGKLHGSHQWERLIALNYKVNGIRVSSTRGANLRLFVNTGSSCGYIDPDSDDMLIPFHNDMGDDCFWLTPVGKDVLIVCKETGGRVLLRMFEHSSDTYVMCVDITNTLGGPPNIDELNENLIVRRRKQGTLMGVIVGYRNNVVHTVYKSGSGTMITSFHITGVMGTTYSTAAKIRSKADTVHIADMLLEVGGLLSILLKNGTIVQYRTSMREDLGGLASAFKFISSRRTDVIGLNLIRSPHGLRIVGLVNDYKLTNTHRTCADDMSQIKAIIDQPLSGEMNARVVMVDPYSSTVECRFPAWNTEHLKSAFLPDFHRGIMNTVVVGSEKTSREPDPDVLILRYSFPISPSISLARMRRPPGIFKGVASVKLDQRYYLVAAAFLNIHLYILDTATGSFNERAVFGWDSYTSAPILFKVDGELCWLSTHTGKVFSLIRVTLTRTGDGYDIELIPLLREVVPKTLLDQYPGYSFEWFRCGVEPADILDRVTDPMEVGHNAVKLVYKHGNDNYEAYISVSSLCKVAVKSMEFKFEKIIRLKTDRIRQFLQIPTAVGFIVVEEGEDRVIFRHGKYLKEESVPLPIRVLSPTVFFHLRSDIDRQLVWNAVVDGENCVSIYSMTIGRDGSLERYRAPVVIPFSSSCSAVKLFIRSTSIGLQINVFVYRLIEGSNHLEVFRITTDANEDDEESIDCKELPRIFLEMDGVENLDAFDVHFINGQFLFINDGPRLIHVCECMREQFGCEPKR